MPNIKSSKDLRNNYNEISKFCHESRHACDMVEAQVFIANGWQKPEGFCDSAWDSVSSFVMTLAHGGEDFYDGWMENKKSIFERKACRGEKSPKRGGQIGRAHV